MILSRFRQCKNIPVYLWHNNVKTTLNEKTLINSGFYITSIVLEKIFLYTKIIGIFKKLFLYTKIT